MMNKLFGHFRDQLEDQFEGGEAEKKPAASPTKKVGEEEPAKELTP